MGFNRLGWFSGPKVQLKVAKVLNGFVIRRSGVHSGEDNIEVDSFSRKDVVPLHVGELWDTLGAKNSTFSGFEVDCLVLDHLPGEFLTWCEYGFFTRVVSEPSEK